MSDPVSTQSQECPNSPTGKHYFPPAIPICTICGRQAIIVNGEVLYCPTEKQAEYHARTEPHVLIFGGRGSGKSKGGRWDAHMRALAYPGFKYCILRRTYPELEASHILDVPKEMYKLGGKYHNGAHIARYHNGSVGFYRHCSTDQDVYDLLSAEFHLMFFDEISTFGWDMFTKLSASCRVSEESGLTAMIRGATNPLGASAETINRYWVLKDIEPDEDERYDKTKWYSIKANIEDNPHIDKQQYLDQLAGKGMAAHVRKAWIEGEFGLENALFDVQPYKLDSSGNKYPYHYIDQLDIPSLVKNAQIYRAFDMGYFPDPAYCVWIAHLGHRYIAFHEKFWYKTIVSDIAEEIKRIDEDLGIKRVVTTFCDPTIDIKTGADVRTMKDTFELHGISMECSVNNREHFAASIHSALAEVAEEAEPNNNYHAVPRLQIYVQGRFIGCPYLSKTLPLQRYDEDHPLRLADHPDDHPTVSVAYFLISTGAMEHKELLGPKRIRKWMKDKLNPMTFLGHNNVRGLRH